MAKAKDAGTTPWQVGALVTVLVALIGAFATIYSQRGTHREPEGPGESLQTLYRAEVKAALNSSRIVVDEAFAKLDPSPLRKAYTGYALSANEDAIRRLKEQGAEAIEFDYVAVQYDGIDIFPNPLHARVQATITKTITIRRTQSCERAGPYESKVTAYLKHTADKKWLIYSVEENKVIPAYVPCS
jgi:hypothetical protein